MRSPAPSLQPKRLLFALSVAVSACASPPVSGATFIEDWSRMKPIEPRAYVCPRAGGPIRIDGVLDDPAWNASPWTDDFVDIEGDARPRPRFRTRARMLWDDTYFYIAADMEEPHVWGTLTRHDAVIFQDNDFEVFLDPDGDSHEYFEFEINALNTGWDLYLPKPYKDEGKADNSWEIPGLKTAIRVHGTLNRPEDRDQGWSLEIAFPWTAFDSPSRPARPPRDGEQWRINFSRVEWQVNLTEGRYEKIAGLKEDNWVWSPQGIIDMHRPEKWGYIQFTSDTKARTIFRRDPHAAERLFLQELYYRQRAFHEKEGRWAGSLEALGMDSRSAGTAGSILSIDLTGGGYVARTGVTLPDGTRRNLFIRQDALIRLE